jgi:hypothetical protein
LKEFTITHNFAAAKRPPAHSALARTWWDYDQALTLWLWREQSIGIRFIKTEGLPCAVKICEALNASLAERDQVSKDVVESIKGLSPSNRQQLRQLYEVAQEGSAMVAAYKVHAPEEGPTDDHPPRGVRLVGHVPANSSFQVLTDDQVPPPGAENQCTKVLHLKLHNAQLYSSTASFLGNLPPMRRSLQSCHRRALGRLAHLAGVGPKPLAGFGSLHNKDLEWVVHNWLVLTGMCTVLYAGSSSDEDVDHKGWDQHGGLVLGQTTRSEKHVPEKLQKLSEVASIGATRIFFCPKDAVPDQLPTGVLVEHLEDVYRYMSGHIAGRAMLESLLNPKPLTEA